MQWLAIVALGIGPVGIAFFVWDIGMKRGDIRVLGAASYATPVLSTAFQNVAASRVTRSGYLFQMFLPDGSAVGVAEAATGGYASSIAVDANQCETLWCCYAWPQVQGNSGKRTFFVNQSGDILATNGVTVAYNGSTLAPTQNVAYLAGTSGFMGNRVASNSSGLDGNFWVVVQ